MTTTKARSDLCISVRLLQPFLKILPTYQGFPVESLKDLKAIDPDERIPIVKAHQLLELAVQATGDPDLGLKAGRLVDQGELGAFDFAVSSAATVKESIEVAGRYMRLLSDALDFRMEIDGERVIVHLDSKVPLPRAAADYQATSVKSGHLQLLDISQIEWWFLHPKPDDTREYEPTFGPSRTRFSAPCFGYTFPKEYLTYALPTANPKLHGVLRKHAELLIAELPRTENFADRVRDMIARDLARSQPSAESVARKLRMSRRTLARKLCDESTTFSDLLDDTRRRLALRYLVTSEFGLSEIAFLLGFSEAATFYRAFKRWTGQTPLEYRRSQAQ
jgi:AraC-like DNA-binding protein